MHTIGNALLRMNSGQLFLFTLMEFLVFMLFLAAIAYGLICTYNEKHRLGGVVDVRVALLETVGAEMLPLHYGCFPIPVQDQDEQQAFLFFPQRNWLEKGLPRMYPVLTFLGRFTQAFGKTIGLESDESLTLLNKLLEDPSVHSNLGAVYPTNKGTLGYYGLSKYHRDEASQQTLCVTYPLPRRTQDNGYPNTAADDFAQKTGCEIRTLRITLAWKP